MPIHIGKDSKGYYFQFGKTGAKYYYKNTSKSRQTAYDQARRQGAAISIRKGL